MSDEKYSIPTPLGSITVSEDGCVLNGTGRYAAAYRFLLHELPNFEATEETTSKWTCTFDLEHLGWFIRFARAVKDKPPVSGETDDSTFYCEIVEDSLYCE